MGETGGTRTRPRVRATAVVSAIALASPTLLLGGALAYAAESAPSSPTSVSVQWTGADGQPVGPGGVPTTTTTETGGHSVQVAPTPSTDDALGVSVNGGTGSTDGSVQQTIGVSVLPGPLTITPSAESISFVGAHGRGNGGPLAGALSPITVVDARGSLVGWEATVSLHSVTGVSVTDLARARFCVSPDGPTVVAGNPPEVRAAQSSCGGVGDPLTLFLAPPNGGGGTFSDTGGLTLSLPGVTGPGPLTATVGVAVH
jgi:hypothetical protein